MKADQYSKFHCSKCNKLKPLEETCQCGCPGETERIRLDLEARKAAGLKPKAGDVVKLGSPWKWGGLPCGSIGVLGGMLNEPMEQGPITFRATTFRDNTHVSCSGGPGTAWTPINELLPTEETHGIWVWRFDYDIWGADRGRDYFVTVPVWIWNPKD